MQEHKARRIALLWPALEWDRALLVPRAGDGSSTAGGAAARRIRSVESCSRREATANRTALERGGARLALAGVQADAGQQDGAGRAQRARRRRPCARRALARREF